MLTRSGAQASFTHRRRIFAGSPGFEFIRVALLCGLLGACHDASRTTTPTAPAPTSPSPLVDTQTTTAANAAPEPKSSESRVTAPSVAATSAQPRSATPSVATGASPDADSSTSPAKPTLPVPLGTCLEEPTGIAGQWQVRKVTYAAGKPSFVPKYFRGVSFGGNGLIAWHDGCNQHMGRYRFNGEQMTIDDLESTLVGCDDEDDIGLHETTRFELSGDRMKLFTPTQTYELGRDTTSVLTRSAWSLFAITNRQTGESTNVDRFRLDYGQLLLETEEDKHFKFVDLDYTELTGSVDIEKPHAIRMRWSPTSQHLLKTKIPTEAPLPDANQNYAKTKESFPTSWAHRLELDRVTSFCVVESTAKHSPRVVLELRSDRAIYTFAPR